jgi:hypothetical protein
MSRGVSNRSFVAWYGIFLTVVLASLWYKGVLSDLTIGGGIILVIALLAVGAAAWRMPRGRRKRTTLAGEDPR